MKTKHTVLMTEISHTVTLLSVSMLSYLVFW